MRRHGNVAPVANAAVSNAPSQPVRDIGLFPRILFRDLVIGRSEDRAVHGVTGGAVASFCQLFAILWVASLRARACPKPRLDRLRGEHHDHEQSDDARDAASSLWDPALAGLIRLRRTHTRVMKPFPGGRSLGCI